MRSGSSKKMALFASRMKSELTQKDDNKDENTMIVMAGPNKISNIHSASHCPCRQALESEGVPRAGMTPPSCVWEHEQLARGIFLRNAHYDSGQGRSRTLAHID